MSNKLRLDVWLVEKGYFPDLRSAEIAIRLGQVRSQDSGKSLEKPGTPVPENLAVQIEKESPYVSRGGLKLHSLLEELNWDLRERTAVDVGSSTGGFTDVLLQAGAGSVYAIDVGTHQLHERLRADDRVTIFEQTDIRNFDFSKILKPVSLVVVDVSFISLKSLIHVLLQQLPYATYILLIKPQFEVDRYHPKKRGVVDEVSRQKCLKEMLLFFRSLGLKIMFVKDSSIKGTKGNQETFAVIENPIAKHIFRTYDIRGRADTELPDATVERIGRAFARRLVEKVGGNPKVGVGWDDRYSSPRIRQSLIKGLLAHGAQVVELGSVPTPMAYYSQYVFDLEALMQITASHNPKDDNGLKMMIQKNTLFGDEILGLYDEAEKESIFLPGMSPPEMKMTERVTKIYPELRESYLHFLHTNIKLKRKYNLAIDCGNGMAGSIARAVFAVYAKELNILYEEVDCNFPNHEADPTVAENVADLRKAVLENKADIGFAFDGDADRLGVITPKGRILYGDEILMLLAELVLKRQPGSTIIGEVKCSDKLFRMIADKGGKPLMYRTGHSLIKKKMKEVHAPIAGEMSGHLFFSDRYYGFDDAIYGALRVLEVIDELNLDLDEWIEGYPSSFVTPEVRVFCEESEKVAAVERVRKKFEAYPGAKLQLIDGVRVSFSDGSWALVRASNTQAVLVVRIEANTQGRLTEISKLFSEALGQDLHV